LLSDYRVSFTGHSFVIHHFGLYLAAAIFLFALFFFFFFWGYIRGRRVAWARSVPRDEFSVYFGRMADSLETLQRAASQISLNLTASVSRAEASLSAKASSTAQAPLTARTSLAAPASLTSKSSPPEPSRQEVPATEYAQPQEDAAREVVPPVAQPVRTTHLVSYSIFGR
jgi:hypothetical protein